MSHETCYLNQVYKSNTLSHQYGENIHLISNRYLLSLVEKIGRMNTEGMSVITNVKKCFTHLFAELAAEQFQYEEIMRATKMQPLHPEEGFFKGELLSSKNKVIVVDVARAGMLPSQIFFEELLNCDFECLPRQDHIYAARVTNNKDEVIGVEFSGSKIGGDIDNAFVLIPDPMGATGSTICEVISHYKNNIAGKAIKFITAHLIITPEYIKNIQATHPDVEVYSIRIDRGLSSPRSLKESPGTFKDEESGLNQHQYIVPGAGGVGELLNNSFV